MSIEQRQSLAQCTVQCNCMCRHASCSCRCRGMLDMAHQLCADIERPLVSAYMWQKLTVARMRVLLCEDAELWRVAGTKLIRQKAAQELRLGTPFPGVVLSPMGQVSRNSGVPESIRH